MKFGFFIFILLVFATSCNKKKNVSLEGPTTPSPGILSGAIYNSTTLKTEFSGANLNWLGDTGTDYVIGVIPGAAPIYDGIPINMVLAGYTPGTTSASVPGSASLSHVFICPAGTTRYNIVLCSGPAFCP